MCREGSSDGSGVVHSSGSACGGAAGGRSAFILKRGGSGVEQQLSEIESS